MTRRFCKEKGTVLGEMGYSQYRAEMLNCPVRISEFHPLSSAIQTDLQLSLRGRPLRAALAPPQRETPRELTPGH